MKYIISPKFYLFLFLWIACIGVAFAQLPPDPTFKNITPPPPDTWQFMKYGEYPVSRETGVPNISVPIYTVTAGELSVPVSLSYHASGIKVDEIASSVGLGWTLNGGGLVTRTIKGLPDESFSGLLFMQQMHFNYFDANGVIDTTNISKNDDYDYLMQMRNRTLDSDPDIFSYNFGGHSGHFFLDPKTKTATGCMGITQPKVDIVIQAFFKDVPIIPGGSSMQRQLAKIVATTPEGNVYTFATVCSYSDGTSVTSGNASWYLNKIQAPSSADSVTFSYVDAGINTADFTPILRQNMTFVGPTWPTPPLIPQQSMGPSSYIYNGVKVLSRIDFPSGKVIFNYVDDRIDDNSRRLASIAIYDNIQTLAIKTFKLDNKHYFINDGTITTLSSTPSFDKRLKLTGVKEYGMNDSIPPYEFLYRESGIYMLPSRHSKAQDYWGYFNGKISNQSLIPSLTFSFSAVDHSMGDAIRDSDKDRMQSGIIQSVKYPTGGRTDFTFEANTVKNIYQQTLSSIVHNYEAAAGYGHNIETVTTFTPDRNMTVNITSSIVWISTQGGTQPVLNTNSVYVRIQGAGVFFSAEDHYLLNTSQTLDLTAGNTYTLHSYCSVTGVLADINLSYSDPGAVQTITENKVVGGLRIKAISNFDANGARATNMFYKYNGYDTASVAGKLHHTDDGYSSGHYTLNFLPKPEDFYVMTSIWVSAPWEEDSGQSQWLSPSCGQTVNYSYDASESPANQLGMSTGDIVNYAYVTESDDTVTYANGKTIYNYDVRSQDEEFSLHNQSFTMDRSWRRGQILGEFYYDRLGAIAKEVDYKYETITVPATIIRGLKSDQTSEVVNGSGGVCICPGYLPACPNEGFCTPCTIRELRKLMVWLKMYTEPIEWKRLAMKTEKLDNVRQVQTFEYEPLAKHSNTLAMQTINSKNEVNRTEIRYAYETNNTEMLNRNMIDIPLQADHKRDVSGSNILAGGSRLTYGYLNGLFVPIRFEERLTDGTYRVQHEIGSVNATSGRIESYTSLDGLTKGVKWGYNNAYPVLMVVNAAAKDVFYSSFEDGTGTVDANSKTGNKISTVPCTLNLYNLTNGLYVLTYWTRNTSGVWVPSTPSTVNVTAGSFYQQIAASATAPIDEVRFYPVGSQVTTYTYDPLVGATSVTDPNNVTTYYNYDSFNRLKLVKDFNLNIMKALDYNYQMR